MIKLKMQTRSKTDENIKKIGEIFPSCITMKTYAGKTLKTVDFDLLKGELGKLLVEGSDERYQFNWPDKKKSIILANSAINKTLRPVRKTETVATGVDCNGLPYCSSGSVDFDNTRNLYIEGDNLDVLKLLQETYLKKIKMIYIDPPYNTGNDFVYEDDFSMSEEKYLQISNQTDEKGNRLFQNTDSNGRFHTDWLNMLYPRLKLARDLLKEDGLIFISIDDGEVHNLRKICDEIFGDSNFYGQIVQVKGNTQNDSKTIQRNVEYVLCYSRQNRPLLLTCERKVRKEVFYNRYYLGCDTGVSSGHDKLSERKNLGYTVYYYEGVDNARASYTKHIEIADTYGYKTFITENNRFISAIAISDYDLKKITDTSLEEDIYTDERALIELSYKKIRPPKRKGEKLGCWTWGIETFKKYWNNDEVLIKNNANIIKKELVNPCDIITIDNKQYVEIVNILPIKNLLTEFPTSSGTLELASNNGLIPGCEFQNPKNLQMLKFLAKACNDKSMLVLDFFSGSATMAQAIMELNSDDGGERRFIMVQIPEESSGQFKNICEIGKERIRRAGERIKKHSPMVNLNNPVDTGFRVLKLDSSNEEQFYYMPENTPQKRLEIFIDNIKKDRTPEDLLFQVMLDIGIDLSSQIKVLSVANKNVFCVGDMDLIACFDTEITREVVIEIAKKNPLYAVFRDSSFGSDDIKVSAEKLFETYSKTTKRMVI
jgi:adenine-specific DNA-methyltransferase